MASPGQAHPAPGDHLVMSNLDDIALVRKLTGTYDADSTPGYYDAVKRVLELAELAAVTTPPSDATKEQLRAWGTANYRGRIAAQHKADNYKATLERLQTDSASLPEHSPEEPFPDGETGIGDQGAELGTDDFGM